MEYLRSFAVDSFDYKEHDFGMVADMKVVRKDQHGFAEVFSEGSPALKKMLLNLWDHGIETYGCCIGHELSHIYTKDSLFGGSREIDEQTYLKHVGSKRYHDHVKDEEHAYFAFSPKGIGDYEEIRKKIETDLTRAIPDISFCAESSPHIVTVILKEYYQPLDRERFFSAYESVMERNFFAQEKVSKRFSKEKKVPLIEQIRSAEAKSSAIQHPKQMPVKETAVQR